MAAPTTKANFARVLDALEWLLNNKLNNANGFRTDGACIVRGKDPRKFKQDNAALFATKNRIISIKPGDALKNRKKSLGGRNRWQRAIALWCTVALTTEQQKTPGVELDQVAIDLQTDLDAILDQNTDLRVALTALHQANPTAGYDKTSCIGLKLIEINEGEGSAWPQANFLAVCMLEFDQSSQSP